MENNKKKNNGIWIAVLLLLLGGGVVYSAIKIYQNSTKPISPSVPNASQAQETSSEGCVPCDGIFFTISAQSAPTLTPTSAPIPSSTPKPTSTPVPTATIIPSQPTSTPVPTNTLITQVNPTPVPSYGGTTVNNTSTPTSTPKPVKTSTLPDAGVSYPTLILVLTGVFLTLVSFILI